MSIEVLIKKDLGAFKLNIAFQSDSRRIGILGASGCGKSLTLKSIAGIERPDEGRIVVNGKTLFDSSERMNLKPQLRKVGYLFQNYALFPTMTVEQNIAAGLTGKRGEIMQRVRGIVEQFHLNGLEKRLPGELSGGQQQRVALARMLICEPEVILLDEPFSALDVYLRDQMQRNLMEMLETYLGIVIFLFLLAIFDLTVGVSNDAVNFLNSAIGAKAASFKTIILIAAAGIFCGATMSNGMMEIARHGIFRPEAFHFNELMCIFLAVMVTDVVLLDIFNTLGMPTSTTVSMVFELLGGTFALAMLKIADAPESQTIAEVLKTEKA